MLSIIPCLSKLLNFSSCHFKDPLLNTQSPLTGQLTQAWASTANNKKCLC